MNLARTVTALIVIVVAGSQTIAAPLDLGTIQSVPDIASFSLSTTYDAGTGALSSTSSFGPNISLTYDGVTTNPGFGETTLDAIINTSGILQSGTLSIFGTMPVAGVNTPSNLLRVNLTQMGFQALSGGDVLLEFLGTVTSGALAADFGGIGATTGTILTPNSDSFANFGEDFLSTQATGEADTFAVSAVPTPAAALMGGPLLSLSLLRRRRRRRQVAASHVC